MGIIFHRTLKCENCGFEYQGKFGGHIISNGEHYGVSQYYCKTCNNIIDLEYHFSLKENTEKYFYPDGTEVTHSIEKTEEELNLEEAIYKLTGNSKNIPPICQVCGNHLFKLDIDNGESSFCPKCRHKSLKLEDIHVSAYVD